jgi:hypothetical protein
VGLEDLWSHAIKESRGLFADLRHLPDPGAASAMAGRMRTAR